MIRPFSPVLYTYYISLVLFLLRNTSRNKILSSLTQKQLNNIKSTYESGKQEEEFLPQLSTNSLQLISLLLPFTVQLNAAGQSTKYTQKYIMDLNNK